MHIDNYNPDKLADYASSLARVGALSNLFSESKTPFIHYRATEYLYTRALEADNLARSDITIDAKRGNVGVGLKTFVYNNRPKYEKVAEFNKEHDSLDGLNSTDKAKRISELRNERIDLAGRVADVDTFIYHCIARLPGKIAVFEQPMPRIDVDNVHVTSNSDKNIAFTDGVNKYKFSTSKSTLYKEFYSEAYLFEKNITIYDDPFELLNTLEIEGISQTGKTLTDSGTLTDESVILPLYGLREKEKYVYERSGLNQWNAGGRARDYSEVYIPIPAKVRELRPDFLPPRDQPFLLNFPDGQAMEVKVCQDDGKALMSKRNAELGEWLLRDNLGLKEGELLTYGKLEDLGIDSVEISKINGQYHIDFKTIGSYENFVEEE